MKRKSDLSLVLIKRLWEPVEDQLLTELVQKHGIKEWALVSRIMNQKGYKRLGKQCRERWFNHLSPDVRKDPWTFEEDAIIILAHQKLGNKWTNISRLLTGRPANAIKNHWNSTLKRQYKENIFQYKQNKFLQNCADLEAKMSTLNSLNKSTETGSIRSKYKVNNKHSSNNSSSSNDSSKSKILKRSSKLKCRKKLLRYSESNVSSANDSNRDDDKLSFGDFDVSAVASHDLDDESVDSQRAFTNWSYSKESFNYKSNMSSTCNDIKSSAAVVPIDFEHVMDFAPDRIVISSSNTASGTNTAAAGSGALCNTQASQCAAMPFKTQLVNGGSSAQSFDSKDFFLKHSNNSSWHLELKLEKPSNFARQAYWDNEFENFNNDIINHAADYVSYHQRSSQSKSDDCKNMQTSYSKSCIYSNDNENSSDNNNMFDLNFSDDHKSTTNNLDDDDENLLVDISKNYNLSNNTDEYEVANYSNTLNADLFKMDCNPVSDFSSSQVNSKYNINSLDWNPINSNEHFNSYYDHNLNVDLQFFWTV